MIRGTTLIIPAKAKIPSRSNKRYPLTQAYVPHYSADLSRDRLGNQIVIFVCTGSHQTPALWSRT